MDQVNGGLVRVLAAVSWRFIYSSCGYQQRPKCLARQGQRHEALLSTGPESTKMWDRCRRTLPCHTDSLLTRGPEWKMSLNLSALLISGNGVRFHEGGKKVILQLSNNNNDMGSDSLAPNAPGLRLCILLLLFSRPTAVIVNKAPRQVRSKFQDFGSPGVGTMKEGSRIANGETRF
ncbi:hypothetical protein BJY00DRAFT_147537 [Aspergillus carlsbadensis]|nr:hypothetical protein BJY00DRAFT_147537 [Aspergillus carlsbadensis]